MQLVCANVWETTMRPRFTDLRKEILDVINSADTPINVKQIVLQMKSQPDLSTVYRALDFLEKKNLIQSLSFSRRTFYYSVNPEGCGHFIACTNCHEIRCVKGCVSQWLQDKLEEEFQYHIQSHVLYFQGLCPECQHHNPKKERASV